MGTQWLGRKPEDTAIKVARSEVRRESAPQPGEHGLGLLVYRDSKSSYPVWGTVVTAPRGWCGVLCGSTHRLVQGAQIQCSQDDIPPAAFGARPTRGAPRFLPPWDLIVGLGAERAAGEGGACQSAQCRARGGWS